MSNSVVGQVYQAIIDDVINSSRLDFEEAGVNAATLEDLKKVWQQKLSDMKIAQFPWDPQEPELPRPTAVAPPAPQSKPGPQGTGVQVKQEGASQNYPQNGVKIKSEPGLEQQPGLYGVPTLSQAGHPMATTHDPQVAALRAQQNIQQKFGGGLVLPGITPATGQQHVAQYRQLMNPQQPQRQANGQLNGMPQHDGADEDDDEDEIPVEGFGALTREEADRIILQRVERAERKGAKASAELAEALRSLKAAPPGPSKDPSAGHRRRNMDAYEATHDPSTNYPYPSPAPAVVPSSSKPAQSPSIPQLDGESPQEQTDEDAINSDLDDPNEDELESDEDADVPQIMLCMYDKVQRTKNKWKCVLKDGILTINGKEYVFHKANGEYEW